MSNESLRSFHFQQIASWPVHVKTAWKYEAAQSFIAPGVTNLTGFELYCINYFPLYYLMQASSLKVVTQSFCKNIVWPSKQKFQYLNGYVSCGYCWGTFFLPAINIDKNDLNTVVAAFNIGKMEKGTSGHIHWARAKLPTLLVHIGCRLSSAQIWGLQL